MEWNVFSNKILRIPLLVVSVMMVVVVVMMVVVVVVMMVAAVVVVVMVAQFHIPRILALHINPVVNIM